MGKSFKFKNNSEYLYPYPYLPVGSIYLSINDINPSGYFGGTWEQIAKGRTLVGVDSTDSDFNTAKKTGGEKTHTLSVNEMPSHTHSGIYFWGGSRALALNPGTTSGFYIQPDSGAILAGDEKSLVTAKTGGGQTHNNLQPYFTCYIWLRTA